MENMLFPTFTGIYRPGKHRFSEVNFGKRGGVFWWENTSERRNTRHLSILNGSVNAGKHPLSGVHCNKNRPDDGTNEWTNAQIHQTENITKVKDFTLSEKLENARKCRVLSFLNGNAQTFLAVIPKWTWAISYLCDSRSDFLKSSLRNDPHKKDSANGHARWTVNFFHCYN